MQQIKFRGKRIDNNEWVYGCYVSTTPDESFILLGVTAHIKRDDYEVYMIPVKPETVGQYIGSTDRYEKEIYVGDTITHDLEAGLGEPKAFGAKTTVHGQLTRWYSNIVVTGNIHDKL